MPELDLTELESNASPSGCAVQDDPRLRQPDRNQVRLEPTVVDELISPDDEARTMWAAFHPQDEPIWSCDPVKGTGPTISRLLNRD